VYAVERWATNVAGDLVLVAGGVTYDGYQSDDDGFVLYSPFAGRRNGMYLGWRSRSTTFVEERRAFQCNRTDVL